MKTIKQLDEYCRLFNKSIVLKHINVDRKMFPFVVGTRAFDYRREA